MRVKAQQKGKRRVKLKWLKKLYKDAKNAEADQDEKVPVEETNENFSNPFDENRFEDYDEETFGNEVNNLIEWIDDLDYDKYIDNWQQIATSTKNEMAAQNMDDLDEEAFMQDNENYEAKLKEHLYLFKEKEEPSPH
jgi:hypothetical protein